MGEKPKENMTFPFTVIKPVTGTVGKELQLLFAEVVREFVIRVTSEAKCATTSAHVALSR